MTNSSNKPFLLISGGPTTRALWPLLAPKYRLVFVYPQAGQQAIETGIGDALTLSQFFDPPSQDMARNTAALLAARVVNNLPAINSRLAFAYAGQHPPAMLNSRFPDWFAGFAYDRLMAASNVVTALERAGAQVAFAGLIVHEDVTLEMRACIAWANARNIPTIHVSP